MIILTYKQGDEVCAQSESAPMRLLTGKMYITLMCAVIIIYTYVHLSSIRLVSYLTRFRSHAVEDGRIEEKKKRCVMGICEEGELSCGVLLNFVGTMAWCGYGCWFELCLGRASRIDD